MLTEGHCQYQALECTFRWTLKESARGTSEICGKQNFLCSSLSNRWQQKNTRASGVAWGYISCGTAANSKCTVVGDHRVLNSKWPKRDARAQTWTRFLAGCKKLVCRSWYVSIRKLWKIKVWFLTSKKARKNDDTCVHRVGFYTIP